MSFQSQNVYIITNKQYTDLEMVIVDSMAHNFGCSILLKQIEIEKKVIETNNTFDFRMFVHRYILSLHKRFKSLFPLDVEKLLPILMPKMNEFFNLKFGEISKAEYLSKLFYIEGEEEVAFEFTKLLICYYIQHSYSFTKLLNPINLYVNEVCLKTDEYVLCSVLVVDYSNYQSIFEIDKSNLSKELQVFILVDFFIPIVEKMRKHYQNSKEKTIDRAYLLESVHKSAKDVLLEMTGDNKGIFEAYRFLKKYMGEDYRLEIKCISMWNIYCGNIDYLIFFTQKFLHVGDENLEVAIDEIERYVKCLEIVLKKLIDLFVSFSAMAINCKQNYNTSIGNSFSLKSTEQCYKNSNTCPNIRQEVSLHTNKNDLDNLKSIFSDSFFENKENKISPQSNIKNCESNSPIIDENNYIVEEEIENSAIFDSNLQELNEKHQMIAEIDNGGPNECTDLIQIDVISDTKLEDSIKINKKGTQNINKTELNCTQTSKSICELASNIYIFLKLPNDLQKEYFTVETEFIQEKTQNFGVIAFETLFKTIEDMLNNKKISLQIHDLLVYLIKTLYRHSIGQEYAKDATGNMDSINIFRKNLLSRYESSGFLRFLYDFFGINLKPVDEINYCSLPAYNRDQTIQKNLSQLIYHIFSNINNIQSQKIDYEFLESKGDVNLLKRYKNEFQAFSAAVNIFKKVTKNILEMICDSSNSKMFASSSYSSALSKNEMEVQKISKQANEKNEHKHAQLKKILFNYFLNQRDFIKAFLDTDIDHLNYLIQILKEKPKDMVSQKNTKFFLSKAEYKQIRYFIQMKMEKMLKLSMLFQSVIRCHREFYEILESSQYLNISEKKHESNICLDSIFTFNNEPTIVFEDNCYQFENIILNEILTKNNNPKIIHDSAYSDPKYDLKSESYQTISTENPSIYAEFNFCDSAEQVESSITKTDLESHENEYRKSFTKHNIKPENRLENEYSFKNISKYNKSDPSSFSSSQIVSILYDKIKEIEGLKSQLDRFLKCQSKTINLLMILSKNESQLFPKVEEIIKNGNSLYNHVLEKYSFFQVELSIFIGRLIEFRYPQRVRDEENQAYILKNKNGKTVKIKSLIDFLKFFYYETGNEEIKFLISDLVTPKNKKIPTHRSERHQENESNVPEKIFELHTEIQTSTDSQNEDKEFLSSENVDISQKNENDKSQVEIFDAACFIINLNKIFSRKKPTSIPNLFTLNELSQTLIKIFHETCEILEIFYLISCPNSKFKKSDMLKKSHRLEQFLQYFEKNIKHNSSRDVKNALSCKRNLPGLQKYYETDGEFISQMFLESFSEFNSRKNQNLRRGYSVDSLETKKDLEEIFGVKKLYRSKSLDGIKIQMLDESTTSCSSVKTDESQNDLCNITEVEEFDFVLLDSFLNAFFMMIRGKDLEGGNQDIHNIFTRENEKNTNSCIIYTENMQEIEKHVEEYFLSELKEREAISDKKEEMQSSKYMGSDPFSSDKKENIVSKNINIFKNNFHEFLNQKTSHIFKEREKLISELKTYDTLEEEKLSKIFQKLNQNLTDISEAIIPIFHGLCDDYKNVATQPMSRFNDESNTRISKDEKFPDNSTLPSANFKGNVEILDKSIKNSKCKKTDICNCNDQRILEDLENIPMPPDFTIKSTTFCSSKCLQKCLEDKFSHREKKNYCHEPCESLGNCIFEDKNTKSSTVHRNLHQRKLNRKNSNLDNLVNLTKIKSTEVNKKQILKFVGYNIEAIIENIEKEKIDSKNILAFLTNALSKDFDNPQKSTETSRKNQKKSRGDLLVLRIEQYKYFFETFKRTLSKKEDELDAFLALYERESRVYDEIIQNNALNGDFEGINLHDLSEKECKGLFDRLVDVRNKLKIKTMDFLVNSGIDSILKDYKHIKAKSECIMSVIEILIQVSYVNHVYLSKNRAEKEIYESEILKRKSSKKKIQNHDKSEYKELEKSNDFVTRASIEAENSNPEIFIFENVQDSEIEIPEKVKDLDGLANSKDSDSLEYITNKVKDSEMGTSTNNKDSESLEYMPDKDEDSEMNIFNKDVNTDLNETSILTDYLENDKPLLKVETRKITYNFESERADDHNKNETTQFSELKKKQEHINSSSRSKEFDDKTIESNNNNETYHSRKNSHNNHSFETLSMLPIKSDENFYETPESIATSSEKVPFHKFEKNKRKSQEDRLSDAPNIEFISRGTKETQSKSFNRIQNPNLKTKKQIHTRKQCTKKKETLTKNEDGSNRMDFTHKNRDSLSSYPYKKSNQDSGLKEKPISTFIIHNSSAFSDGGYYNTKDSKPQNKKQEDSNPISYNFESKEQKEIPEVFPTAQKKLLDHLPDKKIEDFVLSSDLLNGDLLSRIYNESPGFFTNHESKEAENDIKSCEEKTLSHMSIKTHYNNPVGWKDNDHKVTHNDIRPQVLKPGNRIPTQIPDTKQQCDFNQDILEQESIFTFKSNSDLPLSSNQPLPKSHGCEKYDFSENSRHLFQPYYNPNLNGFNDSQFEIPYGPQPVPFGQHQNVSAPPLMSTNTFDHRNHIQDHPKFLYYYNKFLQQIDSLNNTSYSQHIHQQNLFFDPRPNLNRPPPTNSFLNHPPPLKIKAPDNYYPNNLIEKEITANTSQQIHNPSILQNKQPYPSSSSTKQRLLSSRKRIPLMFPQQYSAVSIENEDKSKSTRNLYEINETIGDPCVEKQGNFEGARINTAISYNTRNSEIQQIDSSVYHDKRSSTDPIVFKSNSKIHDFSQETLYTHESSFKMNRDFQETDPFISDTTTINEDSVCEALDDILKLSFCSNTDVDLETNKKEVPSIFPLRSNNGVFTQDSKNTSLLTSNAFEEQNFTHFQSFHPKYTHIDKSGNSKTKESYIQTNFSSLNLDFGEKLSGDTILKIPHTGVSSISQNSGVIYTSPDQIMFVPRYSFQKEDSFHQTQPTPSASFFTQPPLQQNPLFQRPIEQKNEPGIFTSSHYAPQQNFQGTTGMVKKPFEKKNLPFEIPTILDSKSEPEKPAENEDQKVDDDGLYCSFYLLPKCRNQEMWEYTKDGVYRKL